MSNHVTSLLRTIVPVAWGSFVAWLLSLAPWPAEIIDLLSSDAATLAAVGVAIAAWYEIARVLEPRIPDWFTRIILGAAAEPIYLRGTVSETP